MKRLFTVLPLVLGLSLLVAQQSQLGTLDFPNSGSPEAQEAFIEGVLLLHSFEYEDAEEAFQQAQKIDPEFAMAYWGEAMTHHHPVWHRRYEQRGRDVLENMGEDAESRISMAKTEKEKDWIKALEILYGEGDKEAIDIAFTEALGRMHASYPDDHEIASFYAVNLLGTSHAGRDTRIYMKSASVVEEVYADNPLHPGALHYLIHSYDDPIHAPLGLRAARRYAKVAPAAAHALHMPSHIFVALGMWPEVVSSNEESSAAADARRARKALDVKARGYHSLWWLQYGYLQQGRYEEAYKLLEDMVQDAGESENGRVQFHLAVMRAAYIIDAAAWDDPLVDMPLPGPKISERAAACHHFTTAFAKGQQGDMDAIQVGIDELDALIPGQDVVLDESQPDQCCAPVTTYQGKIHPNTLKAIRVMKMELQAQKMWQKGKKEAAILVLQEASQLEESMDFMFGPPVIVKPSHEQLGKYLLKTGQYEAAIKAFQAGLERAPGRTLLLMGLKNAADFAKESQLSSQTLNHLKENWSEADPALKDTSGIFD